VGRVRRGEIWLVAGGVYASKPRPAVILQDDRFDTDSVTVCPLTTTDVEAPLLRLPIPADDDTGISQPSFAMVDKLTTIRRSNVGERVGRLTSTRLVELERLILVFLGFGG
jgi:mRNA interferase MazF